MENDNRRDRTLFEKLIISEHHNILNCTDSLGAYFLHLQMAQK